MVCELIYLHAPVDKHGVWNCCVTFILLSATFASFVLYATNTLLCFYTCLSVVQAYENLAYNLCIGLACTQLMVLTLPYTVA